MLNTPAPFPEVGSFAIYEGNGREELARIQHRHEDGTGTIFLGAACNASSARRVPLVELRDATPLTAEEGAELDQIEDRIAGQLRPRRALLDRYEHLIGRFRRAPRLTALVTEYERIRTRHRRAA